MRWHVHNPELLRARGREEMLDSGLVLSRVRRHTSVLIVKL